MRTLGKLSNSTELGKNALFGVKFVTFIHLDDIDLLA
jgi:hypothetical protein